jgi:hypothetical protein
MDENTIDQADEQVLNCEVSDDALEAAADTAEGRPQVPSMQFSGPVGFPDFCC